VGLLILLAGVVQLFARYRSMPHEDRQPVKPLALAGAVAVLALAIQPIDALTATGQAVLVAAVCFGLPAALAIGALRYRVWDFDRVLVATFVYTALTALITAVYVGVVLGAAHLAGRADAGPALLPSVLATALVAAGVSPVKSALERAARRLVHGVRADPYLGISGRSSGTSRCWPPPTAPRAAPTAACSTTSPPRPARRCAGSRSPPSCAPGWGS
jgi:hypothetical protein